MSPAPHVPRTVPGGLLMAPRSRSPAPAWPGAAGEELNRHLQSLEERCRKVNLRWVLWTSSMGTAI